MVRVLVLEDDELLNNTLCKYLNNENFYTFGALNAIDAFDELLNNNYDIIISDVMMPNVDGFEFLKKVRDINKDVPFIFITAKDDFKSKEKGYRLGIDDYMVKPIDLDELLLRLNAVLRRCNIKNNKEIEIGNLKINSEENTVLINGEEVSFTVKEFNILFKLLSYPKKTFTRNQLMDEFWEYDKDTLPRTVDVYMTKIREKCSNCDGFEIQTVHGLGYKVVLNEKK